MFLKLKQCWLNYFYPDCIEGTDTKTTYLSMDIECNGSNQEKNDIIRVGLATVCGSSSHYGDGINVTGTLDVCIEESGTWETKCNQWWNETADSDKSLRKYIKKKCNTSKRRG